MSGSDLTAAQRRELFGERFDDDLAAEAEERWGGTDAWRQSSRRTSAYTVEDWRRIAAQEQAVRAAVVAAKRAGDSPGSDAAMDAAEAHRRHIDASYYDLSYPMHRALADMYVSDPRFTQTYDATEPGLAQYLRDAIHANADRHEVT